MDISVVIPVYGCPEAVDPLCERLTKTLTSIVSSYEVILVNDGCPKGSWYEIKKAVNKYQNIKGINLSRNFGQIHATNAGINVTSGDYVVLMDCDLQDKPEGIVDLYNEIKKGKDIVFVKRKDRKDNPITIFFSKMFYRVYNHFVDGYYDADISNFSIATRKIVDEYKKIGDNNKTYITMLCWMGYNSSIIEIEGEERYEGKSSYNFSKKINLAIDMITSQSNKPLKTMIKIGLSIVFLSFVYIAYKIILYFITKDVPEGWTSMIASVFMMGGVTLICLGVVGIYVGNIFTQTKNVPEYFIDEIIEGEINDKNITK